jgi:hypothetical protein
MRALLWLAGLALVVGALLLTDRLLWQPGLTADNVRRIPQGVMLAQAERLLSSPDGDEMTFLRASRRAIPSDIPCEAGGKIL